MNRKIFAPFAWLLVFVIVVGIACSFGGAKETPEEPTAVPDRPTREPIVETDATATSAPSASGAAKTLREVQGAVIQILGVGVYVDPERGPVEGRWGGTGFFIDPSGIAVTNNHVVTGASALTVYVGGDQSRSYDARVLGVSECNDLAVIQVEGGPFPYLNWFGDTIEVGQDLYIAGFPLVEPEYNLVKGIVSKLRKEVGTRWAAPEEELVSDAGANPGNSGGPIITPDGQVLGVFYAVNRSTSQVFGIPRDVARPVVDRLRTGVNVDSIGVNGEAWATSDGGFTGVFVKSVQPGSPADRAGVKAGDIIATLGDLGIAEDGTMASYCKIVRSHGPNDTVNLEVLRPKSGGGMDVLAGQLNGRQLEVTSSSGGGGGGGGGSQTGGNYSETFDDMSNWTYFILNGNPDGVSFANFDNRFRVDVETQNTWSYYIYEGGEYSDVRIDVEVENRASNTNFVGIICRYSDSGWYEANILNTGEYFIYYYSGKAGSGQLLTMYKGMTRLIKTGRSINNYTLICAGEELVLGINGVEAVRLALRTGDFPFLSSGQTGLSVSTSRIIPVVIDFLKYVLTVQ